jgi:serine/threonine-protein kinase
MPPEQAQGLDTVDRRADVWALGAIAYECMTGQVPFKGVNGPSILLEILTKEPTAPSLAGAAGRGDIPGGVDDAVLRALKKPVGLRTPSVGQFADDVGRGYGLTGDHRSWAAAPEQELAREISVALADKPTVPRKAATVTDAFFGEREGLGVSHPPHTTQAAGPGDSSQIVSSLRIPMHGRPSWLAPVLVAATALLAGVVLALLFI